MARTLHLHSPCFSTTETKPPQISKLSESPPKTFNLKQICKQGDIKQAFISFTNQNHTNTTAFALEEAYSSLLDLCASHKALLPGQQIHAHILTSNAALDTDFLNTKLVFMYGKCGCLSNARSLFDGIAIRTVFAWNALIGAYASYGWPQQALELYQEMRVSGILVDSCTFPLVLKACGAVKDLCLGAEVHGFAIKSGFSSVDFVVNSLVTMYTKCNCVNRAIKLFDNITTKEDVVLWNSIMSAHLQSGQYFEALRLFKEMQRAGIAMNSYTVVAVLQACAQLSFAKLGMEIHADLLKSSGKLNLYEANALVVMYARSDQMGRAVQVFHGMDEKDNVSWNSMLSGYVQNGLYEEALEFFRDIQECGHKPDQVSVVTVLLAAGRLGKLLNGMECHATAIKHGFDLDLQVGNSMIVMYGMCSCVNYANRVFQKMPDKDLITWTTVIGAYAQNRHYFDALELFREVELEEMEMDSMMIGSVLLALSGFKCVSNVKEIHGYIIRHDLVDPILENSLVDVYGEYGRVADATRLFEKMVSKDLVSWTNMINCYVHNGFAKEAFDLFRDMVEAGVQSDSVALISALSASSSLCALRKGKEIHGYIIRSHFVMDGSIGSSLVDMYSHCGTVDNCYKVFDTIIRKDLVLWTSMINASGMHGRGKEAINLFTRMEETGLVPDHVTFLALLFACSHSGLIEEGKGFFKIMRSKYHLDPWPEHYACVVDLLGRSNCLIEAYEFIKSMPIDATEVVWCTLLGACRVHRNIELGEVAAGKLLEMGLENPGNYVLVSNLFACNAKWREMGNMRMRMKEMGLKKNPACSWIEMGNKVHSFIARDHSHPQTMEIYSKLDQITTKLEREGGYVADTDFVLHDLREDEKIKMLYGHSERLAIAFGLINTQKGTTIRITKNLRVCGDCHQFTKLVSKLFRRQIVVRDSNRFHHFEGGICSCGDFW